MNFEFTIIVLDPGDLQDLVISPNDHLLCFSPLVEREAKKHGFCVKRASLSDIGHARCVAFTKKILGSLNGDKEIVKLSPGLRVMARQSLGSLAFLICRLRLTVGVGPWRIRTADGSWTSVFDRKILFDFMLPRIWSLGLGHSVKGKPVFLPKFYLMILSIIIKYTKLHNKSWVLGPSPKLKYGLREALGNLGVGLLVLRPTQNYFGDYWKLLPSKRSDGSPMILPVPPVSTKDRGVKEAEKSFAAVGALLDDHEVARGWSLYVKQCSKIFPFMISASRISERLAARHDVRNVFAYEANEWWSAGILEGAGAGGAQRNVLNHNSHPFGIGRISDEVLRFLFLQRTANELVDCAGVWSPSSFKWARLNQDKLHFPTVVQPVSIDFSVPETDIKRNHRFKILHAGNYQNLSDFFPWLAETSFEYLVGMEKLAYSVSNLQEFELVFRVRSKVEIDALFLREKIGALPNVSVCDESEDFLAQLMSCDLLVSHFSTTVEQGLQLGKPVLLWGSAQRYTQFQARMCPPSIGSRAAVYAVNDATDLPHMLSAIRLAHSNRPLTDSEVSDYLHCVGTNGVEQWVQKNLLYRNSSWHG